MTPSGIETATFRFVAQHLNHRATAAPARTGGPLERQEFSTVVVTNRRSAGHANRLTGQVQK